MLEKLVRSSNQFPHDFFYNIINHKQILIVIILLPGNAWTKTIETNYQNKNTKGEKEG